MCKREIPESYKKRKSTIMARKPVTVPIPHPYRQVVAEYTATGQGVDYFLIYVDGNHTYNYVEVPEGTRPLAAAVREAYEAKFASPQES